MWVDNEVCNVGDVRFLVRTVYEGKERYALRDDPPRTNRSGEPRIDGWCGATNNRSTYAEGMVRVVKVSTSGERAKVERLTGQDLADALESAGYPDLAPSLTEADAR